MLGARIAALRKAAGLNQAELARRLQVSPSTVGMYEQGRREPSGEILLAIARELKVTTDYLLSGQSSQEADMEQFLMNRILAADRQLETRKQRPFSREELVVLFAAMLMEG